MKAPLVEVVRVVEIDGPRGGAMFAMELACGHAICQRKAVREIRCWVCCLPKQPTVVELIEAALDAALGEVRRQGGPEYLLREAKLEGLSAARMLAAAHAESGR